MKDVPRILLLIESSRAFGQGLLRGVARYSRLHGPWMFYRKSPGFLRESSESAQRELREIHRWKPQGAMYWPHSFSPREEHTRNLHLEKLFSLDIPIVVSKHLAGRRKKNVIDIGSDTRGICEMAARHLLERGLEHFGFCGYNTQWSQAIGEHFADFIRQEGCQTAFYQAPRRRGSFSLSKEEASLAQWLESLRKPSGIMALNDDRSQDVIEAAKLAGIHIPQEIAVVGVDNDEFICDMCYIPLSSVRLNTERAGYTAAEMLDRAIRGQEVSRSKIVISPVDVVCRQSTDIVATDDEAVADAVRFIRQNSHRRIKVDEVAQAVGVSRRGLEVRFRRALHYSINHEIMENRANLIAERLLHSTDTISQIAYTLGFDDVKSLSDYFYRVKKIRPLHWRKKYGQA